VCIVRGGKEGRKFKHDHSARAMMGGVLVVID